MSSTRWAFNISKWEPSKQEFLLASSCLQIEEKNRLDKFVFKKDVKATLAGRLMIRKFIFQNTGRPYNSIIISRESNNKPVYKMSDTCTVSFNVSHHGSFTVLAGEVGNQRNGRKFVILLIKKRLPFFIGTGR
ncbi:L-aminoadipate-semialdehyde dehydrogenase-phosphopantetheinyl transferase [Copidosoma floridanum]|uniref:L-aminoadipate-semialdehyde dehydrogenase-phosphopantetheinyl transferase n=1 Tax=Copidosoma floridanum TaxID=29053 RepID=UPI000C6F5C59|nr:L-aminoadipate-semialdehyde dehydrogenase-phosphopantetheinyl transferase [Copidosoma floridanum]